MAPTVLPEGKLKLCMVPVLEVWYWRQPGGPAISFKPQSYWVTLILQLLFRVEPKPTWKLALWHDWLASTHTKKKDIELSTKKVVHNWLITVLSRVCTAYDGSADSSSNRKAISNTITNSIAVGRCRCIIRCGSCLRTSQGEIFKVKSVGKSGGVTS